VPDVSVEPSFCAGATATVVLEGGRFADPSPLDSVIAVVGNTVGIDADETTASPEPEAALAVLVGVAVPGVLSAVGATSPAFFAAGSEAGAGQSASASSNAGGPL
jgi:hypothetical protein